MKNKREKNKPPAASAMGMLPSDERQGGMGSEESGHQTLVLRGPSKLKEKTEPFASPFGAGEDKARARGYHQQSAKEAAADSAAIGKKKMTLAPAKQTLSAKPSAVDKPADENAPITRTTLIMDIVYKYPEAVQVLVEAGLHCVGCQLSVYDDFQTGCAIHGFDEQTIDELVVKMNAAVQAAQTGSVAAPASAKNKSKEAADCC